MWVSAKMKTVLVISSLGFLTGLEWAWIRVDYLHILFINSPSHENVMFLT